MVGSGTNKQFFEEHKRAFDELSEGQYLAWQKIIQKLKQMEVNKLTKEFPKEY